MRFIFSRMSKEVYREYPAYETLKDYIALLEENIKSKEEYLSLYLSNPIEELLITKPFVPSKTAQIGINFITRQDEQLFSHENLNNIAGKEEVIGVLKIIYILLRQNYEKVDENLLGDYLINKILVKMKVDSLSKSLFIFRNSIPKCDL